ncbi:MAG: aminotransferase class V-fold PLP-dependent enzyme [Gemmatales bacterium]|nr:aminotransferase class V-fold PLP-dependent enzyme [Gemmatales bacterium]MDW8176310.1 aminotransferase class V-fold PLP-dependent enzyme [Gemmatales bacterium]
MTIYLDNAATTFPKPESVYRAMDEFARTQLANPGRAGHRMALASERVLDDTRHLLNQLFRGESPERFIFTLNCTDALNMAIKGVLHEGDHVITTNLEHNSVSRPLQALADAGHITLSRIPADGGGTVDPEAIRRAITPKTRLLVVTHASNVLGTVQPVHEIAQIAREYDVLFLVDAAQTAGVVPIDLRGWGIDLLAFPGHKSLLGPTGTGGLYVGSRVQLRPWREGGTGGDSASPTQPCEMPFYLEGGTPNVVGVAGLAAGIRYILQRGQTHIHEHEMQLIESLRQWLLEQEGFEVFGHAEPQRRVATLSFRVEALPASDVAAILDASFDIAVRPGLHCAPYIHRAMGTFPEGTVRVSVGPFNTQADVEALCQALSQLVGNGVTV